MNVSERYQLARDLGLTADIGRGLVEHDQGTHAVLDSPGGLTSRCGAGPILRQLPGLFDDSDPLACPRCVELQLGDFGL